MNYELKGRKVLVCGHRGMVGSALVRRLEGEPCEVQVASRLEADFVRQTDAEQLIARLRPDAVIIAAAKVGGIHANNSQPAEFLYENLMIAANLIEACHQQGVGRVLFLGSSCIYPKFSEQPIQEHALLTGVLEPTNEWYAIAKIAGIKLAQAYRKQYGRNYISAMPTNLYGPEDNYDLNTSHVLPALIRKAHEAKMRGEPSITIWGTGKPMREFMHADDCADALVFLLKEYSDYEHVNVGSGSEISILDLAKVVCRVVGFVGDIEHDLSKPDGTPRKLMSSDKLWSMGWRPRISLEEGIRNAYESFMKEHCAA